MVGTTDNDSKLAAGVVLSVANNVLAAYVVVLASGWLVMTDVCSPAVVNLSVGLESGEAEK